ncbi:hypothetical protein EDB84DRAFT_1569362 [Lactarius hengduanensis]|nr:hypothetical protein EDB84DRAFT_1569362 [Lactarius hengduanensis]
MALRDPTIFNFDQLFELNAVLTAQMRPLFVLRTFLSGTPHALHAWQKAHTDTSRSVHDRDLNRAAGSSTVSRAYPVGPAGVSTVGHALREDLGEYRIWISTSLLSPGAVARQSRWQWGRHRSCLVGRRMHNCPQGSVGFDVDTSSSLDRLRAMAGIGMADWTRVETSALLLINPPWVKTKVETPHSDLHTLFEFILFFHMIVPHNRTV